MSGSERAGVLVYGAYGHTGRFVVDALRRRGLIPVLSGRNPEALSDLARSTGFEARPAAVTDAESLAGALRGVSAVVNCAGPFAETAGPLITAALESRTPYVDVAAEIEANADTFDRFSEPARAAGTPVVPAMAFYGGLGDLLATAAMGDWGSADEIRVAYGLSGWYPTAGTRAAGAVSRQRRDGRHVFFEEGALRYGEDRSETVRWDFPFGMGAAEVRTDFSMADIVTIPSHLPVPAVSCLMTATAAADLASPETPAPHAVDDRGRSDQTFVVDVAVRRGSETRRASAAGTDIYAITGPLAATAVDLILSGRTRVSGLASAGAMFDAAAFLDELDDIRWTLHEPADAIPTQR